MHLVPIGAGQRNFKCVQLHSGKLTTVRNYNGFACLSAGAAKALDLLDYIHALGDTAKDDVLAIQPVSLDCAQEELQHAVPVVTL